MDTTNVVSMSAPSQLHRLTLIWRDIKWAVKNHAYIILSTESWQFQKKRDGKAPVLVYPLQLHTLLIISSLSMALLRNWTNLPKFQISNYLGWYYQDFFGSESKHLLFILPYFQKTWKPKIYPIKALISAIVLWIFWIM